MERFISFLIGLCVLALVAMVVMTIYTKMELTRRGCLKTGASKEEMIWVSYPTGNGGTMMMPTWVTHYQYRCPDNGELVWF